MTPALANLVHFYIIPDGRTASTLKEVRQMMKVSGRRVSFLVKAGIVKKIVEHQNVKNDEEETNKPQT